MLAAPGTPAAAVGAQACWHELALWIPAGQKERESCPSTDPRAVHRRGVGEGPAWGSTPPILGQTRLEAPPMFSQLWLGGCSPSSLHTVGLRPSSCAHPGMTSVLAGMGGALAGAAGTGEQN
ncbi:unnamed protein product [Rangifer tarandus platyrhynchus]|uniref:Uncharacterized protein n=1 Tax=Rangifer tarandus platyrhynchus TaxID=3082113 RepID=A0AC59YHW3_RANTA